MPLMFAKNQREGSGGLLLIIYYKCAYLPIRACHIGKTYQGGFQAHELKVPSSTIEQSRAYYTKSV